MNKMSPWAGGRRKAPKARKRVGYRVALGVICVCRVPRVFRCPQKQTDSDESASDRLSSFR